MRKCTNFIPLHVAVQFYKWDCYLDNSLSVYWYLNYWRGCLFLIEFLPHRLTDHMCVSLVWGILFYSRNPCVCFYSSTILFYLLHLGNIVWSQGSELYLWFFFFSQNWFGYLGSFVIYWIIWYSVKNVLGIFIGLALHL